ncbi:MAG: NAD(P)H-dependent oxidoreductase [Oscillospiraceae bacterium]|jgi:multimeric flavodoxin WrbA|nr:NAD(P)H-dependent oxidoreductase [Oscillospiraceae bacterium]
MKIAVLHGQNHKGSTWNITRLLLDEMSDKAETVLEFHTNELKPCAGCFTCIARDETLCPHRSAVGPIIDAIEQADVIIAESPNYCMGMSGQMKIFFDHMGYRWMSHRPHPSMKGKTGVAISTTAGIGAAKVTKSIARQMFWWGVAKTYRLSFAVSAMSWENVKSERKARITNRIKRSAKRVIKSVHKAKPGLKSRFIFAVMKTQQKGMSWNPADRKYWEENGWI